MTKFTSSLFAFSAGLVALKQAHAQVTIFVPSPTDPALQPPSVDQPKVIGVSAIGIASDGLTQYEATEVATAFVVGESTVTFISLAATLVLKFEEGASAYRESDFITIAGEGIAISADINCGPGNGGLNCVENAALLRQGALQTSGAATFAATESPIFTIQGAPPTSRMATSVATESPISTSTGSTGPLPTGKSSAIHPTPFIVSASLFMGFVYALVCTL